MGTDALCPSLPEKWTLWAREGVLGGGGEPAFYRSVCELGKIYTYDAFTLTVLWVCKEVGLVTKSCPTLKTSWTVAHQDPLFMGFPRQEYWSGLPFPSSGDLPSPGIEPRLPALQADCLPAEPPGKSLWVCLRRQNLVAD